MYSATVVLSSKQIKLMLLDGVTVAGTLYPASHNQFARFKGYAFFDCVDAGLLPWNTTKSGIDVDSPIFLAARQIMIQMMRPVIDFLNKVDRELDSDVDSQPLTESINSATLTRLSNFDASALPQAFTAPRPPRGGSAPRISRISYNRPSEQVIKV